MDLVKAAYFNDIDKVLFLVNNNNINYNGSEALVWACFRGNYNLVVYLITNGSNIPETAIIWSILNGHYDIINYFIYLQIKIEDSYIKIADTCKYYDIVELLEHAKQQ